jgi:hypothetical protein
LSGPSHRSAKFEKFERTLEFSDSEQNLKNLSGPDTIRETLKIGI